MEEENFSGNEMGIISTVYTDQEEYCQEFSSLAAP
jgi:hypothetical protein